ETICAVDAGLELQDVAALRMHGAGGTRRGLKKILLLVWQPLHFVCGQHSSHLGRWEAERGPFPVSDLQDKCVRPICPDRRLHVGRENHLAVTQLDDVHLPEPGCGWGRLNPEYSAVPQLWGDVISVLRR